MLIKSNNEYYQRFQFSGISRDLSLHRGLVTGGLVIGRQWVVILLSWRRGVGVWLSRGRVGKLLPRGCVESRGCVWHARIVLSRVRLCRVHTGYCVCCKFKHFIGEKINIFLYLYFSDDVLKPWWNSSLRFNLYCNINIVRGGSLFVVFVDFPDP